MSPMIDLVVLVICSPAAASAAFGPHHFREHVDSGSARPRTCPSADSGGLSLRLSGPHRSPRSSFMKIKGLFRGDIERPIETVIHVDLSDEQIVAHEIDEYVVTNNIRDQFEELAELYAETVRNPSESTNVWVSGFFGSGKSSFAKMIG